MRLNLLLPSTKAKRVSLFLNLSILVMILLVSVALIKRNYFDKLNLPRIVPGAKLSIKGVDLAKTDRTLLLAIKKDCKYCTESARFYRRLADDLSARSDIRMVALFPKARPGVKHT